MNEAQKAQRAIKNCLIAAGLALTAYLCAVAFLLEQLRNV